MTQFSRLLALPIAAVLVLGCGDDGDTSDDPDSGPAPITVNSFVGTWQATSHVYTNNADGTEQYDVMANGGVSRMTVLTAGRARTWLEYGDFADEWDAQLALDGDTITATPAEATRPTRVYTFALDGDALTLTSEDESFDFTLSDGTPVSATVLISMTRE